MLRTGQAAPDFELPDENGRPVTLSVRLAERSVVLFFYPGDFTPVCTREVCMIRDAYAELTEHGFDVLGVSPDSVESHARFHTEHSLPYSLLADPEKRVIRLYGVGGPFGLGVRRATYVIGQDAQIRDVIRADLRLAPHRSLLRRAMGL